MHVGSCFSIFEPGNKVKIFGKKQTTTSLVFLHFETSSEKADRYNKPKCFFRESSSKHGKSYVVFEFAQKKRVNAEKQKKLSKGFTSSGDSSGNNERVKKS